MKKAWIGLGIAGGVVLVGGFVGKLVYDRLSKNGNEGIEGTFTTEAIATLTPEASVTSSGGSMGAILWTFLALALLGAIVGAFYWWWGRGQNEG